MEHIAKAQLALVQTQVSKLIEEVNQSVQWSNKFLKEDIRSSTNEKIKQNRRKLKKIEYALLENPSSALYGESQVGKSYLIKNLLSTSNGDFNIIDESTGESHNFLEKINPKGEGTEATSVVTRFSTQVEIIDEKYPIKIRLLSPKDIVLLLVDSYFSDVEDHVNLPNGDKIRNHIDHLAHLFEQATHQQSYFTEDDVYDIRDYLEQNFKSFTTDLVPSGLWDFAATIIEKLEYSNWYKVFEIIWGKNPHITAIFNDLIEQLSQLGFPTVAYAEFKSVLREHGTILHVSRLREITGEPLYEDVAKNKYIASVELIVKHPQGIIRHVANKSKLCALAAELVFKVDKALEENKDFLKNSDLLDFPGARSRLKNQESKLEKLHIGDMVLRGKVSYIFNKYSAQYLISNLFFCNKNQKIEVKYIPKLLNTWIETYIGATPEKREEFLSNSALPPLFVIYTFFNADLEYNPINDNPESLSEKWTKRFNTIFENEIVTNNFNWHKNWTVSRKEFPNNYMLRDFHYSNTIYKGYRDQGEEEKIPLEINSFPAYFDKLKESFITHPFVNAHFNKPEETWDASATPNNDGSALILANLGKASTNYARTQKFIRELNQISQEVKAEMDKHYHSDEADKRIRKAAEQAGAIHINMDIVFGQDAYAFGNFMKGFIIKESVVYNLYKDILTKIELVEIKNINHYVLIRNSNPELRITKAYEENIAVLMKTYTYLRNKEEVEAFFADQNIDLRELFYGEANNLKNNSLALAEALRDFWFSHYLIKERFEPIAQLGFSTSALEDLFANIKTAFDKLGLVKIIAQNLRDYVDRFDKIDVAEEMIADISAGLINKFITSMGWSFYSTSEIENLQSTNQANQLGLNFEVENAGDYIDNAELAELFDHINEYNELISQVNLNHDVVKNFPNIKNISRWRDLMKISFIANCNIPVYDMLANTSLGELLKTLGNYHFQLQQGAEV